MSRKKTHEEYIKEVSIKNPNIEVVGTYINAQIPILHRCLRDGHTWPATPSNILRGSGCPMCCGNIKKTQEQYVLGVANINPNIEVVDMYIDARTPIKHRCRIDGHIWNVAPYVILRGDGCPKCAGNAKKTTQEYIDELSIINSDIEVLEEYINSTTPIAHRCKIDGNIWNISPANVLNGRGCPICKAILLSNIFKKTHQQYIEELSVANPDIEAIGEYINAKTPILHRCKIDGHKWMIAPSNILSGQGCPVCQESNGERTIRQWLQNNGFSFYYQYKFNDCCDKKPLPFDFYLPTFNICIEYDGLQHFQPIDFANKGEEWAFINFQTAQYHDKLKNKYCQDNNIPILRIPYFKNIEEELEKFLFI